jgi:ferric-dicitrate binding protein FerR (iron transport regulator)
MTMTDGNRTLETDEAIEALLRKAPPRPAPSDENMASVRDSVKTEWLAISGKRRARRRLFSLAAAATVILAIAATVNVLRVPSALPIPVATIGKTVGSIYLLGEQSQLHETPNLTDLSAGQTLVTGIDSGAAITWLNGGSLRIDADTRVEFVSPDEIVLRSGRVYFDSQPASLQAGITQSSIGRFAIRTDQGIVKHIGTQYMTGINGGALTISVREGEVEVENAHQQASAVAGQQMTVVGSNRPTFTNISRHGDNWRWVEQMAPEIDIDQRSAYEFISWAARESGFEIRFVSDAVEQRAHETVMSGTVDLEPQDALHTLLQTTDLGARIQDGWIVINER